MKPKAQTLQQKMGFFDEDLVKPKHDELMMWLDANIENVVNEIFNKPYDNDFLAEIKRSYDQIIEELKKTFTSQIQDYRDAIEGKGRTKFYFVDKSVNDPIELQNAITEKTNKLEYINKLELFNIVPEKPRIKTIKKVWELPVLSQNSSMANKYTVGFIDFAATFNIPTIFLDGIKYRKSDLPNGRSLDDIEEIVKLNFYPINKSIYIEVKTEIKSIGELIRQINQYRTYLKGDYYVLCPDDGCRKILEDQNIGFIDYK